MQLETITGEITATKILGSDFFGRANVKLAKGSACVIGKLLGVQEGDTVEVTGVWDDNARFGKQFKARTIKTITPRDASGVVGWMEARLPNLGRARASAIVERFGVEGVWNVIENEPDRLLEVDGITPPRRDLIVAAYHEHRGERDRVIRFKTWGLTDSQIARVLGEWGARAEEKIRENPYALAEHVHGFGFTRADTIARRMGLPLDAPARIRAGLVHLLKDRAERGHTYVLVGMLLGLAEQLLGVTAKQCVGDLRALAESGAVWANTERTRVALVELARAEEEVAARLLRLAGVTAETKAA